MRGCADRLSGFLTGLVAGPVLRRRLAPCGGRALAVNGCLVATDAGILPVQCPVILSEPRLHPTQGALGSGQLIALARRPTAGRFVETTLAVVLQLLAFGRAALAIVRALLAIVGRGLANVRDVIALIGDDIATIRSRAKIARPRLDRDRSLGGAALVVSVQLL